VNAAREAGFEGQLDLDPTRIVFIDETAANTKMARLYGRAPRGERCRAPVPHGHWKTTTFTAGLRYDRIAAPMVLDGPMNGEAFLAYVEQALGPELRPGDIVIMDMCGRPRRCKKNLSKSTARGRVLTCVRPLLRLVTCRRPVWEFAERIQFNLARSRRVSMIWFSRSRLVDRCAILSV
jgi:hypothetical protein